MENLVNKVEGTKQEIETGKTLDALYSTQAAQMEALDVNKSFRNLFKTIFNFIKTTDNEYYILNSKAINYITIFKFENDLTNFSNIITDFILNDEGLVALGGLKMYSDEDNKHMIQFYIGDKHFALFPANDFVLKG